MKKLRNKFLQFINSEKETPLLAGIAAGLYPILFYYNNNYPMVNSVEHVLFFVGTFIVGPTLLLLAVQRIFKIEILQEYRKYIIPFFSVFTFLFLLMICVYIRIEETKVWAFLIIADFVALLAYKHYKKIIVLQFVLAGFVFLKLIPDFYRHITYDDSWRKLSAAEKNITFTKTPNIYIIQPDGYANATELKRGYYNYDNSIFENWLTQQGFTIYNDFRSNYYSTLSSNSSLFNMKHHYHTNKISERKDIVGKNNVLSILKENEYQTYLIAGTEYFTFNRTKNYYDFYNISAIETPFIGTGVKLRKNLLSDFESTKNNYNTSPRFFFIESIYPAHITTNSKSSEGVEAERLAYFKRFKKANTFLKTIIHKITTEDPKGIIVIIADHGGYVGMRATSDCGIKTQDRNKIYSIFGSHLSIKWPKDYDHSLDGELKSSVNLFRVLFSYLSDSKILLKNKEKDKSYILLNKGAEPGTYEYIADDGTIQCKKVD